jgi:hypothetical protein
MGAGLLGSGGCIAVAAGGRLGGGGIPAGGLPGGIGGGDGGAPLPSHFPLPFPFGGFASFFFFPNTIFPPSILSLH